MADFRVANRSRIAFGPRAGQMVLTVRGAMRREKDFKQSMCADIDRFSLHTAVRAGADDRQALEQLCRHITHPALARERVHLVRDAMGRSDFLQEAAVASSAS